jgi:lipopolysaccharide export system ATP-binding protein
VNSLSQSLVLQELTVCYGKRKALGPLSLNVEAGEIVSVLGPNGAGKSTMLACVAGLLPLHSGRVEIFGQDVSRSPLHVRCGMGLGWLPQDAASFSELTVEANLAIVAEGMRFSREERKKAVRQSVDSLELTELSNRTYATLSGGERRRVELAKALMRHPRLLLLDEPYAALDPQAIAATNRILRRVAEQGVAILVTDHRYEVLMSFATRHVVLHRGELVCCGTAAEVMAHPGARGLYFVGGGGA